MDVKLNNLVVGNINVIVEKGDISIFGIKIIDRTNRTDLNTSAHNSIITGFDLGERLGVGKHGFVNVSRCITKEKDCGGTIHATFLTNVRLHYSQNEGIVCLTSHAVTETAEEITADPDSTIVIRGAGRTHAQAFQRLALKPLAALGTHLWTCAAAPGVPVAIDSAVRP